MSEQTELAEAMVRELRIRERGIRGDIKALEDRLDSTLREARRWADELDDARADDRERSAHRPV